MYQFFIKHQWGTTSYDPPGPSVTRLKAVLSLNINEYGDVLYAPLDEDVSTATEYHLWLEPKVGDITKLTSGNGVSLGTVDVTVDDEVFLANTYVKYTTKSGDIDQFGLWRIKGMAQMSAARKLVGDYVHITVKE